MYSSTGEKNFPCILVICSKYLSIKSSNKNHIVYLHAPLQSERTCGAFLKIKHPLLEAFCFLKSLNQKNFKNFKNFKNLLNFHTLQMPSGQGIPEITHFCKAWRTDRAISKHPSPWVLPYTQFPLEPMYWQISWRLLLIQCPSHMANKS